MPYQKELLSFAFFLSATSLSINAPGSAEDIVAVGTPEYTSSTLNTSPAPAQAQVDDAAFEKWKLSVASTIENRIFSSSVAANPEDRPLVCKLYFDEDGEVSCVQIKKSVGDRPFEDHVVSHLVGTRLEKPPANATSILASFNAPHTVRIMASDK